MNVYFCDELMCECSIDFVLSNLFFIFCVVALLWFYEQIK